MTHPSKTKGNSFEREIVNAAKAEGVNAERAYASNGKALGCSEEVDLKIDSYKVQAKRRKKIADYLQVPNDCDAVVFRQDRGTSLVLLPFESWLRMVKALSDQPTSVTEGQ